MQQRYPRLAAAIAAIEKTGRTRAEIGRMAGRHASQVSRWADGTALPAYASAKKLSDEIRPERPDLADSLLDAWHYYSDPPVPKPGSSVPPDVLRVIRKHYSPEQQQRVIEELEAIGPPAEGEPPAESESSAG